MTHWSLECSSCGATARGDELAQLCTQCRQPYLVRYARLPVDRSELLDRWDMWRYAAWLPLLPDEDPVALGEGATPLIAVPSLARALGVRRLWVKEEGLNPTGSFKARGMSAAVTRARTLGVPGLVVPTAGNAGAALAAYGAAASMRVRAYAPADTPPAILAAIRAFGAELVTVEGHIGDAGKAAREFATQHRWFDVSTLREPYRIEGKKTMGLEIAEQLGWRLPDAIIYPTGGGTGLIGMWKAFRELVAAGWIDTATPMPRMITAQAAGCAPIVRAFAEGAACASPWENPQTHASGLRVPAPLGDRLILRALHQSHGDAVAAGETEIRAATEELTRLAGIDASPEGGCALAVCRALVEDGRLPRDADIVLFNTGSGASYRS
ncbi:MAG: threonine synthase [Gemmatimonadaceae bacterium]